MRFLILVITVLTMLPACNKNETEDTQIIECFGSNPWLETKMKEYQNCVCLTAIFTAVYEGQRVYEIRVVDPLCNGINVVYKEDGTPLFHSSDPQIYINYLSTAKNLQEIWRCSRNDN